MKTNNPYGINNDASTESANAEVRQHGDADSIRDTTSYYLEDANREKTLRDRHLRALKAAQKGSAEAQFQVGMNYCDGWGVTKDAAKGVEWLRLAAEQGYSLAQVHLGMMYEYGQNVELDKEEALKWFMRAADAEQPVALCMVATYYMEGCDERHVEKAFDYFLRAAEKGDPYSQYMVARMLWNGEGVAQNRTAAKRWCLKAAEHCPEAMVLQAKLIINGDMAARSEGEEIALLKLAADLDNEESKELLRQYDGEMQG